jgi:hypothetical protein
MVIGPGALEKNAGWYCGFSVLTLLPKKSSRKQKRYNLELMAAAAM